MSSSRKAVPLLPAHHTPSPSHPLFLPSPPPHHPLQSPTLQPHLLSAETLRSLQIAAEHLKAERLVAIPTETVYGLGGLTSSPLAVSRIYALKGRPSDNPLISHISSLDQLSALTPEGYTPSPLILALISAFWPGPLTLLFPARNPVRPPPAPQTIGVRFPQSEIARAVITLAGGAISAPSANSSGRPSPTQGIHVSHDLGLKGSISDNLNPSIDGTNPATAQGVLGCILNSTPSQIGLESTVVDALGWTVEEGGGVIKVLRPGG